MHFQLDSKGSLVSVIVPIYMIENYVDMCISSIRKQSYKNLEIIIINDGSTDNSIQIAQNHADEDRRIIIVSQENKGLSAARNEGLRSAHGKYVTFVDGDDWIDSEMIRLLVNAVERNKAQIGCCGHSRESVDHIQRFRPKEECLSGRSAVREWLCNRNIKMMAWGKLYSRELFTENTFFPEGKIFEDTASCWKLFSRSQKVVVLSEILYHYCIRSDSISNSHSVSNIIDRWDAIHNLYESAGTQNEEFEKITMRMCFSCIEYAWHERSRYSRTERLEMDETYKAMSEFSKIHIKDCTKCGCNLLEWLSAICAYIQAPFCIYSIAYIVSRAVKIISSKRA